MQAERWGTVLITEDVELLDLKQRPFTIRSSENEVRIFALSALGFQFLISVSAPTLFGQKCETFHYRCR